MTEGMFGPYKLQSRLGKGGFGEVFRAEDTRKSRGLVALKLLWPGLAHDEDFQRRFLREAELTARLRDPHVIPIHDYGQINGQPYLDMRLVDGVNLAALVEQQGPLPSGRAVNIIGQVGGALSAAHREGLVHRDVKPHNILISRPEVSLKGEEDFTYLIDFGIAANLLSRRGTSSTIAGTAAYMAPERFAGKGDHRGDVYALGCVLYELLTGQPPFRGDSWPELMFAHINLPPPLPSSSNASLPTALDSVIATALAKEPGGRYSDARVVAEAARQALMGGPAAETFRPPYAGKERAGSSGRANDSSKAQARERKTPIWLSLALVATLLVLVVVVLTRQSPSTAGAPPNLPSVANPNPGQPPPTVPSPVTTPTPPAPIKGYTITGAAGTSFDLDNEREVAIPAGTIGGGPVGTDIYLGNFGRLNGSGEPRPGIYQAAAPEYSSCVDALESGRANAPVLEGLPPGSSFCLETSEKQVAVMTLTSSSPDQYLEEPVSFDVTLFPPR